MSGRFEELAGSANSRLEELLREGRAPEPASLAGFEFRGFNTPAFTALLGIRKFIKGFFSGPSGLEGYNIPARQNGLAGPWLHKPDPASPKRFGFYEVYRVRPEARDSRYPNAVLLDYGASRRNPAVAPERVLRDYLVEPFAGDPDVLLGKAYLALGPLRVATSFFVLGRLRPTGWRAP